MNLQQPSTPAASGLARRGLAWWYVPVIAILLYVAFANSFGLYRFFDDWSFPTDAASALASGRTWSFIRGANGRHWAPLWNALVIANVSLVGWESDLAIRTFTVALQCAALLWFVALARALKASRGATLVGLGVLGLHHVSAVTLYSFDTYSQFGADLVTWVVGGLALVALSGEQGRGRRYLSLAIGVLPVGLLMKEQALSGAAVLLLALVCRAVTGPATERRWHLGAALLVTGGVAAFAAARWSAGSGFEPDGAFRLCVTCAPVNMAFLFGPVVLPVRSLVVMDAWRAVPARIGALLLVALCASLLVIALVAGLRRRLRAGGGTATILTTVAFFLLSGVPVVFLGRVGLLYAHTAVFWWALLVAHATDGWLAPTRHRRRAVAVVGVVASAYLVMLGVSLRSNLESMRRTSDRAVWWLNAYASEARRVPPGSALLVHIEQRERNAGDYSLLRLTTPEYLVLVTPEALQHRLGPDVTVVLDWEPDEAEQEMIDATARGKVGYAIQRYGERLELTPWRPGLSGGSP